MNHAGDVAAAVGHGHGDGVADQLGLAVRVHAPPDDAAAEHIEHDRQMEPAHHGRDISHVRNRLLITDEVRERLSIPHSHLRVYFRLVKYRRPGQRERLRAA